MSHRNAKARSSLADPASRYGKRLLASRVDHAETMPRPELARPLDDALLAYRVPATMSTSLRIATCASAAAVSGGCWGSASITSTRDHWIAEPSPSAAVIDPLDPAESGLYADLDSGAYAPSIRFEQERIRSPAVEKQSPICSVPGP